MTAITTTTDPFSTTHDHVADQLEPFCDLDLERFTERDLLHAYDLASGWTDHLAIAQRAAANIAAEWQARHAQSLPRVRSEVGYVPKFQTEVDDIWSGIQRAAKPHRHRRRLDTYFDFPRESTSFPSYGTH
jgi:hypothetical protein